MADMIGVVGYVSIIIIILVYVDSCMHDQR